MQAAEVANVIVGLLLVVSPATAQIAIPVQEVRVGTPAIVTVWNDRSLELRAEIDNISPRERAERVRQRIEQLPFSALTAEVRASPTTIAGLNGMLVTVGSQLIVIILPEDLDPEAGETLRKSAVEPSRTCARCCRREPTSGGPPFSCVASDCRSVLRCSSSSFFGASHASGGGCSGRPSPPRSRTTPRCSGSTWGQSWAPSSRPWSG